MKKQTIQRMVALLLTTIVIMNTGCGNSSGGDAEEKESVTAKKENTPTITMYPADANLTSGLVSGYKGDYFKENGFDLEVWAYSDEKTNAILASGDLPDIMYVSKENLNTMIEAGMLLDLDEYLDKMPHVTSYEPMGEALDYTRKYRSAGTEKLYCLPLSVGDNVSNVSWTDSVERNTVKLRWDIYEEIGAPAINSYDDLIDVMEKMVEAHPTDENGNPFYGTVLNAGSDKQSWYNMILWYRWQGYNEENLPYLLEANMVEGTYSSILDKNSMYYKGLKWYNEVYRRGLMDPDSINNDRATQGEKVSNGYAMVPSGSLPGWAPKYFEYYIPDTSIYYDYNNSYGDPNKVIAINANTEHLDECLKLLDMWCDSDAYFRILNGPDGGIWYSDGENAYISDDYVNYLKEHSGSGTGYTYENGEEAILWNTAFCVSSGVYTNWGDGKGNKRVGRMEQWKEVMEISTNNDTFQSWKETTGYETYRDWLAAENAYTSEGTLKDINTFTALPDESKQLTIDSIKDTVVNASWKMVYSESDDEFDVLWDKMVSDCEGLGAQDIITWKLGDLKTAEELRDSLK